MKNVSCGCMRLLVRAADAICTMVARPTAGVSAPVKYRLKGNHAGVRKEGGVVEQGAEARPRDAGGEEVEDGAGSRRF